MPTSRNVIEIILKGSDESMTATVRSAERESRGLIGTLSSVRAGYLALAAGAAAATAGLVKSIAGVVETARELQSFGQRLGVPVDVLSELKFVAEQNGLSFGQLGIAMQGLTRRVGEAAKGLGEARGALKDLGLDAAALAGKRADEQFEIVADALAGVTSQSERVRVAFKLFEQEGVGLLQVFGGVAGSMSELRARARELGVTMTADTVASLDKAARAAGEVKAAWDGVKQAFVGGLVEETSGINELATALSGLKEGASEAAGFLATLLRMQREYDELSRESDQIARAQQDKLMNRARALLTGLRDLQLEIAPVFGLPEVRGPGLAEQIGALPEIEVKMRVVPPEADEIAPSIGILNRRLARIMDLPEVRVVARAVAETDDAQTAMQRLKDEIGGVGEAVTDMGTEAETLASQFAPGLERVAEAFLDLGFTVEQTASLVANMVDPTVAERLLALGMSAGDAARFLSGLTAEQQRLAMVALALGMSLDEVTAQIDGLSAAALRIREHMLVAQAGIESFGATVVDNFASAAEQFGQDMVDMVFAVDQFADLATLRFEDFVQSALASVKRFVKDTIAEFIKLQLRMAAMRFLTTILGLPPIPVPMATGGPVARKAAGGPIRAAAGIAIPGFGGGDSVPALLEPGEFVLRKEAVHQLGLATLRTMNAAQTPAIASEGAGRRVTQIFDITVNAGFGSRAEGISAARVIAGFLQEARLA